MPSVKLGVHYDDWIDRRDWELSEAVILGYPPVPMTTEPVLIAARGEIHACVTPRHAPFAHFILSTTPRGGFSGGPAIYEDGYALGIVTNGLVMDNLPLENGFQSILSIERIRVFLDEAGLTPEVQKNVLNELMATPGRTP